MYLIYFLNVNIMVNNKDPHEGPDNSSNGMRKPPVPKSNTPVKYLIIIFYVLLQSVPMTFEQE